MCFIYHGRLANRAIVSCRYREIVSSWNYIISIGDRQWKAQYNNWIVDYLLSEGIEEGHGDIKYSRTRRFAINRAIVFDRSIDKREVRNRNLSPLAWISSDGCLLVFDTVRGQASRGFWIIFDEGKRPEFNSSEGQAVGTNTQPVFLYFQHGGAEINFFLSSWRAI